MRAKFVAPKTPVEVYLGFSKVKNKLTKKQQHTLDIIASGDVRGVEELADALDIKPRSVYSRLRGITNTFDRYGSKGAEAKLRALLNNFYLVNRTKYRRRRVMSQTKGKPRGVKKFISDDILKRVITEHNNAKKEKHERRGD